MIYKEQAKIKKSILITFVQVSNTDRIQEI
jgi:hypothetical protein